MCEHTPLPTLVGERTFLCVFSAFPPSSRDPTKSQQRVLLPSEFAVSFESTSGSSFTVFEKLSWYPVVYLVNFSCAIVVQDDRALSLLFFFFKKHFVPIKDEMFYHHVPGI